MNDAELFQLASRAGLLTQLRLLAVADLRQAGISVDAALSAANAALLEYGRLVAEKVREQNP